MVGSLTRRQRRPLWGWLAFLLLVALSASLFLATRAEAEAIAGDGSRPAVQAGRAARRKTWVEARPGGGA